MIRVRNDIGLVGDFLGTVPAMNDLAAKNGGLVVVGLNKTIGSLFACIARSENTEGAARIFLPTEEAALTDEGFEGVTTGAPFDLSTAFTIAGERDLHMTQAHYAVLGLDVPPEPIRPQLVSAPPVRLADFMLAPFSRSLPESQRWPRERWQAVVDGMPRVSFNVLGSLTDPPDYLTGPNVRPLYGQGWPVVMSAMLGARATVSLVSGPAHLAYAIGARCVQLTNQDGAWGNNPEALALHDPIPDLQPEAVIAAMESISPNPRRLYRSDE
jgi:hypothetical protein